MSSRTLSMGFHSPNRLAARDVVHETVRYYLQPSSGEMLLG